MLNSLFNLLTLPKTYLLCPNLKIKRQHQQKVSFGKR
jgi:hypothetical protein